MEGPDEGRMDALVAHVEHARKIGGLDIVAIGTDFDGTSTNHEFNQITDIQKLADRLKAIGYSDDELEKIFWRNALRVIHEVLL